MGEGKVDTHPLKSSLKHCGMQHRLSMVHRGSDCAVRVNAQDLSLLLSANQQLKSCIRDTGLW